MMLMVRIVMAVAIVTVAVWVVLKIDGRSAHACFFTFGR
jgi:hypothetical protein